MNDLPRREALGLFIVSAIAIAGGCASTRKSAGVGDPLPGEPSDDYATDRGDALLREWRERGDASPAGPVSGVLPRATWTRTGTIERLTNPMGGISRITVHHDGMNPFTSTSEADATRRIEQIRNAHVGQGWADIGYHFVIDPAGRIYEGRPLRFQGAHVKDNNEHNLGVMVLGNFMESRPTSAALTSLDGFLSAQMRRYNVPLTRVFTHQELKPTACPGTNLQRHMLDTRSRTGRLARA